MESEDASPARMHEAREAGHSFLAFATASTYASIAENALLGIVSARSLPIIARDSIVSTMHVWRILSLAAILAPSLFAQIGASAGELKDGPSWPEVWGDLGLQGYASGERMAPNGVVFDPIFKSNFNLNLGLLPRKKLYVFLETEFWMQRSSPGVTNDNQGIYDFSKREFDINTGLAWNVFDRLELRASVDALSNLNRGTSRTKASGYEDGGQLEARYYFGPATDYDVGRLSFVGIGYYPAQSFIGGDGFEFRAGMFAQAYATWNIPALRSYLYGHARLIQEEYGSLRLITFDAGIAARPFSRVQNLEFRIGNELTADVEADTTRDLIYAAIRVYYGPSSRRRKQGRGGANSREE